MVRIDKLLINVDLATRLMVFALDRGALVRDMNGIELLFIRVDGLSFWFSEDARVDVF
jgi:hypothetical protein